MNSNFNTEISVIEELNERNGRYYVKTDRNEFSFFKKKKDGDYSKAYKDLEFNKVKQGDRVAITYTVKGEYKNIVGFGDPASVKESTTSTVSEEREERVTRNYQEEAFGKCKHAFLVKTYEGQELTNDMEVNAENWARASMRHISIDTEEPKQEASPF